MSSMCNALIHNFESCVLNELQLSGVFNTMNLAIMSAIVLKKKMFESHVVSVFVNATTIGTNDHGVLKNLRMCQVCSLIHGFNSQVHCCNFWVTSLLSCGSNCLLSQMRSIEHGVLVKCEQEDTQCSVMSLVPVVMSKKPDCQSHLLMLRFGT
jgi:hypothetical protein